MKVAVGIMLRLMLSVFAASVALLVAVPGSALALPSVPPGNSEVDQYLPTVPGSGGDKPLGGGGNGGAPLSPAAAAGLRAAGGEGHTVLKLAESTGPSGPGKAQNGAGGGSSSNRSADSSAGKSVSGAVFDALSDGDSGGMGIFLPLLLAAVAAAGGYAVARRRFRGGGSAGA